MPALSYFEKLALFLRSQPLLSEEEAAGFALLWQKQVALKRGEFLCPLGKVEQHVWFVAEGVLRIYYPSDAEEICMGFAYENTVTASFPSFVRQQPSSFSIQALSTCALCGISRSNLYEAIERWPGVTRFWYTMLEQILTGLIEREVEIHTTTPEERYRTLLARAPHLFQLAPLKYIASYLRIQPETLSRVRAGK